MYYTVKEVAQKTGLTSYTIRYYLRVGLFPSITRNENGTRLFTDADIETFYIIECLKQCGMTINEIRQYMEWLIDGDQNIDNCLELFMKKMTDLEKEKRKLQECMEAVSYKIWYYEVTKQAGTLSVHDTMTAKDIPEDKKKVRERMMDVNRLTQ